MYYRIKNCHILSYTMKQTLRQIFVENLKYYRQQRGLSQQALAAELNKSVNYINGIENNNTFPSVETIEQIAGILAIRPAQLFESEGCPSNLIAFDRREFVHEVTEALYARLYTDIRKDIEDVLQQRLG